MLKSMTAFARRDNQQEFGTISWELRSVNHRYLEVYNRLPEELRFLESAIRDAIGKFLSRGKVECSLNFKPSANTTCDLLINTRLVQSISKLCQSVSDEFGSTATAIPPLEVLKWPGVIATPETDVNTLAKSALSLLEETLQELLENRGREGAKLCIALQEKLATMESILPTIRNRLPTIQHMLRERITNRFDELKLQLEETRIEQEMIMLIQKTDVEEELKRLETHIHEVNRTINQKKSTPVGRRLDFLMQELNREANTLCAKSLDSETTKSGIELKVLIEQMREQVQNIE